MNKRIKNKTTKDKLAEDEFSLKNTKVRITTFIDLDVLKELKKYSKLKNSKYQTELNSILRSILIPEGKKIPLNKSKTNVFFLTEERVRRIIKDEIKERFVVNKK